MPEPGHSPRRTSWRDLGAMALLAVGLLQMVGDAAGIVALKGIGAATAASPLPKVFSDVRGLEPFASHFTLLFADASGAETAREIAPELYGRLGGPYNRRNVYGAALSYAPRLPEPLWRAVFCYGLGPGGPLRREFGVPDDVAHVRVAIATRTRGRTDAWVLEAACGD